MGSKVGSDEPDRRESMLQLLRSSKRPLSIADIAEQVDLHPNTVRFHLDALIRAGRVEQVQVKATGPGRPPVLYQAIRGMDPTGPTNYRLLAQILATYLNEHSRDPERSAMELGRAWGLTMLVEEPESKTTRADAVRALTEVLEDLGFCPEQPSSGRVTQIRIRHCPFLGVVETYGPVICALHAGLLQGVLGTLRAPLTVTRIDPLVEPDLCIARLAATDPTDHKADQVKHRSAKRR